MGQMALPVVTQLSVQCDMPDRFDSGSVSLPQDTSTNITFAQAFKEPPNIQVTPLDLLANHTFAVTSVSETGFTLAVAGSGTANHAFNWLAQGYGKLVT
jgi:hypothetical protein